MGNAAGVLPRRAAWGRFIRRTAAALVPCALFTAVAVHANGIDPTKISLPKGPGSIEGLATSDFSPSLASGAASYDIPIVVPPGAAGFGPNLALAYDSGGGLTEIGIGWRVTGAPKIQRRTEDGLPRFDESDRFELEGVGIPSPLVTVGDGVYRPSIEDGSFVRVTRSPDGATWEARTKTGRILLFGGDGSTEAQGTRVAAYLLREERDLHGHSIAYAWDTTEGHGLLTRVQWNAFDASSTNAVTFDYQTRPDEHRGYATGILETLSRRLRSVTVTHGGSLVRRYELSYGTGPYPTLTTVELVGSDGVSRLPASHFDYTEARLTAGADQLVTIANPPGASLLDGDASLADLDGDGLPDLVVGRAGHFSSYTNHDGKSFEGAVDWGKASPSVSLSATGVELADLDADGAPDLVVKSGKDDFRYFPHPSSNVFGTPVSIASVPGFSFEDPDVRLADMDGDRRTDVVITTDSGIAVAYNLDGADWTEPRITGVVGSGESSAAMRFSDGHTSLCDVNGDRVMDVCSLRSGGMQYWLGQGRGLFEAGAAAEGVPAFDVSEPFELVDLNGDGPMDLVRVGATEVSFALSTGEGHFGKAQTIDGVPPRRTTTAVEFADMNGSGTTDILWVDTTGPSSAAWRYLELLPDGRAGLLRRIDNGFGKVQSIEYAPAADEAARARDQKKPWSTRINLAMPVVVRTTVDTSLGDPPIVTEIEYRDGAYDPAERTFAGFGGGLRRSLGDAFSPTLLDDFTFDTGLSHREMRGAPLAEEKRDALGNVFSQVTQGYTSRVLAGGVAYSFRSSESVNVVEGTPSASRTTLKEEEQDDYGNVTLRRSWGEVGADGRDTSGDESFVVRTYANDPEEWLLGFVATEETTDAAGHRIALSRKYYDGDPMHGLPLGQVTRGDVSREEAWVGPGENDFELVLATRYDADGLPAETTDGRGGGRLYEWASDHTSILSERLKLESDVTLVERADVDAAFGTLLAATDYAGQTTRYEYDPFGRLTMVVKPGDSSDLPTVSYSYQATAPLSRVVSEARVRSGEAEVERSEVLFDGSGKKRGTLTRDGDRYVLGGVTLFDARGNARRALLPRGVGAAEYTNPPLLDGTPRGSDTTRDALGREVRTRSPTGIESRTVHAPFETRHYDGGQTDQMSPYEHTPTVERTDGLGRVVAHVRQNGGATLGAEYVYDARGALVARTDPDGNVSRYGYDGRGRRTRIDDPDVGVHRLVYDATGNVVERHFPDGAVGRFTFDLAGRSLTEDWDGDGKPEIVRIWDHAPDGDGGGAYLGRLARVSEPSGSFEHEYDERGRIANTRYEIDGVAYVVQSEYDAQDREMRHVYSDGSSIEIRRNPRGQVSSYGDAVTFTYSDDGLEKARRLSTGVTVRSGYDDDQRRRELDVTSASGSVIEHLRWSYDAGGNLTRVEDLRPGVPRERDRSETYEYDNLYRLVRARGTWGETAYEYSPSGNLLGRQSNVPGEQVSAIAYDERPHLPSRMDDRHVKADSRGRVMDDGARAYTWNDADQLAKVVGKDGATVENVYGDGGVRRVRIERRADGTVTTTHFIDPWSESEDGHLTRYILHSGQRIVRLGTDERPAPSRVTWWPGPPSAPPFPVPAVVAAVLLAALCRARQIRIARAARCMVGAIAVLGVVAACDGGRFTAAPARPHDVTRIADSDTFIVSDLVGSVLSETDASGTPGAAFATYPFGATRYDTSHATWKYAASPRDGAVGLDLMGARFYEPELGVWTSADPLLVSAPEKLVTADFAAANPYAYANQTPLIASDRDGHFWHIVAGALIGAAFGAGLEAMQQYMETGRIDHPGRIAAAAGGGAVVGIIVTACPAVGSAAGINLMAGTARRLIATHSVGTPHDVMLDVGIATVTVGAGKGFEAAAKYVRPAKIEESALERVTAGPGSVRAAEQSAIEGAAAESAVASKVGVESAAGRTEAESALSHTMEQRSSDVASSQSGASSAGSEGAMQSVQSTSPPLNEEGPRSATSEPKGPTE